MVYVASSYLGRTKLFFFVVQFFFSFKIFCFVLFSFYFIIFSLCLVSFSLTADPLQLREVFAITYF